MPPTKTRGRPRSEAARVKVLAAARELLAEGGIAAVTIEELAERTGVARPTIYRSWPNAKAVAMAALMAQAVPPARRAARSTVRQALRSAIGELIAAFSTPIGRSAAALVASADSTTELAKVFRHQVLLRSREMVLEILRDGAKRGEIRARLDLEAAADLIMAPVFFRLLVGHQPLGPDFPATLVDQALDGLGAQRRPRR
ncbi:MAG: TetR/AcrR family transcriptional regulator [Gemmatimonadales bacterium]